MILICFYICPFRVYEIEERIKTPKKFKFPKFEEVNWLAAAKLKNDLSDLNSDSTLCPSHLLSGIKALLTTLKSWLPDIVASKRTCPPSIDPAKLVRELAKELRLAEKVTLKWNPPKPERESKRKKQKKGVAEDFIDISRGNAFLFLGGRVSTKKKPPVKQNKQTAAAESKQSKPKNTKKESKSPATSPKKSPKKSEKPGKETPSKTKTNKTKKQKAPIKITPKVSLKVKITYICTYFRENCNSTKFSSRREKRMPKK